MGVIKRLLFVTHNYPPIPGGVSSYSQSLCRIFSRTGIEVRVLTSAPPGIEEEFPVIHVNEKSYLKKLRRVAMLQPLRSQILDFKPDVVFLASSHPYGYMAYQLCRRYSVPYVTAAHGAELYRINTESISKLWNWWAIRSLTRSAVIICVSRYTESLVKKINPTTQTRVIHNGVDLHFFSPGEKEIPYWSSRFDVNLKDKFIILSLARLVHWKGIDILIHAIHQLQLKLPDLICLISSVGDQYKNLVQLRDRLKLQNQVIFLGELPRESIVGLIRTSDLLVQDSRPSPGEGFGLTFLEANACGIPVIGSRAGAIPEAVQEGITGLLVDPDNAEQLADAIVRLYRDKELYGQMSLAGIEWAKQHNWVEVARQYREVLESILK